MFDYAFCLAFTCSTYIGTKSNKVYGFYPVKFQRLNCDWTETSASQLSMGRLFIRGVQVSIFRKTSGLTRKFNIGRNRKQDQNQVAKDMRTACTIDGERMFNRTEWLSNIQILGLFSRLRVKQRSKIRQESNDTTDADDGDDDLMEA